MNPLLDRRSLIAGSLALSAGGLVLPKIALARAAGQRNLLFVLLRGAADGLAIAAPLGDPGFAALRERALADYEGAPRIDGMFALHPAFEEVGKSVSEREALVVHAVATAYRERSHFDGQNLLECGAQVPYGRKDGWLNRLVGLLGEAGPGEASPSALAIAPTLPLALRGAAPVSSYAPSALPEASTDFLDRVGALYDPDPELSGLWQRALETQAMAADDGLNNLRDARAAGGLAASLMREETGARIAMIELDGWDTHANQPFAFRRQASRLDALLGAYRDGMGAAWRDTLVIVATEFGRTARFNGTNGTDHGTAGAALLMGGALKGGNVRSDWPGLAPGALHEGRDLRPTVALERVIAGALAEHFRLEPQLTLARLFPGRDGVPLAGFVRA